MKKQEHAELIALLYASTTLYDNAKRAKVELGIQADIARQLTRIADVLERGN